MSEIVEQIFTILAVIVAEVIGLLTEHNARILTEHNPRLLLF